MIEITPYIRTIFFSHFDGSGTSLDTFTRRANLEAQIAERAETYTKIYTLELTYDFTMFASSMFDELATAGVIKSEGDPFAGVYYSLNAARLLPVRSAALTSNEIYKRAERIGASFFKDVLTNYQENHAYGDASVEWRTAIPASDRIVTINHNSPEILLIQEQTDALVEAIRSDNSSIINIPEDRKRFTQQLVAFKSLLGIDRVSVRSVSALVIAVLTYLMHKFGDGTIGVLAEQILKLIATQFGISL